MYLVESHGNSIEEKTTKTWSMFWSCENKEAPLCKVDQIKDSLIKNDEGMFMKTLA